MSIVEIAEDVEVDAMDDYSDQEDLIAKAQMHEAENLAKGDAENVIDAAYTDAAGALLAANLIDEANLSPVAAVIADVWVVEEN